MGLGWHEDLIAVRRTIEAEHKRVSEKYMTVPFDDPDHEFWFGQMLGLSYALGCIKGRMGEE
jgi:hypothetical protein